MPDWQERLESLKAGTVAALSLALAYCVTSIINSLLLAQNVTLGSLQVAVNDWHWWLSGAIAVVSGLLFGVTYRYAIRGDRNPQLKAGAVLAFGLVRGLAQLDLGLHASNFVLPFVVMAIESVIWFTIAAIALNFAIAQGWIKTFN